MCTCLFLLHHERRTIHNSPHSEQGVQEKIEVANLQLNKSPNEKVRVSARTESSEKYTKLFSNRAEDPRHSNRTQGHRSSNICCLHVKHTELAANADKARQIIHTTNPSIDPLPSSSDAGHTAQFPVCDLQTGCRCLTSQSWPI